MKVQPETSQECIALIVSIIEFIDAEDPSIHDHLFARSRLLEAASKLETTE